MECSPRRRLERRQGRHQKRNAKAAVNRVLQQHDQSEPVDLDDGPREMTKIDICNVEFISARDLDEVFDGIIEAASFQHALEDCECRWNIADVDTDMMDLSDPLPFKNRDVVAFRSKRR